MNGRRYLMRSNNSNGSRTASARGFAALGATLALILAVSLAAAPAEAQPFAYVTNFISNDVSVIDTTTNMVVARIPVGYRPQGVAVTPDGQHAYVANANSDTVSVIDTTTNTVVA